VPWDFEFAPHVEKHLLKLGATVASRILDFLETRIRGCADPRTVGNVKPLSGNYAGKWRWRIAKDYRIIGTLDNGRLVVHVVEVTHRSDAYD
jgi:mRNA interferase RelE/StbE